MDCAKFAGQLFITSHELMERFFYKIIMKYFTVIMLAYLIRW